jgi:fructokinase
VDPNIRPSLLPSREETLRRLQNLLPFIDVLKLSDEDAAWLYPGVEPMEALGELGRGGVSLVVLTQGARGSVLKAGETIVKVDSPRVEVADTIGAGDSYMGALIAGLAHEVDGAGRLDALSPSTLERLGQFAAAAAAVTVTRRGANPPRRHEVEAALDYGRP